MYYIGLRIWNTSKGSKTNKIVATSVNAIPRLNWTIFRRPRTKSRSRGGSGTEVPALKHESRILGQWSNPVSVSRKSLASSPWAKLHSLTCSVMEKPHTGLDECPRILLSCFLARNSVLGWMDVGPRSDCCSVLVRVHRGLSVRFGYLILRL